MPRVTKPRCKAPNPGRVRKGVRGGDRRYGPEIPPRNRPKSFQEAQSSDQKWPIPAPKNGPIPPLLCTIITMKIWINEQIDHCGLVYSCIATTNEQAALECHEQWQKSFSPEQVTQGWQAKIRTVESWEEVPVNALKLN